MMNQDLTNSISLQIFHLQYQSKVFLLPSLNLLLKIFFAHLLMCILAACLRLNTEYIEYSRHYFRHCSNCMLQYLQGVFKSVIKFHYGCLVAAAITVIWCTENGYHIAIMTPVVPLQNSASVSLCNADKY